MGPRGAVTDSAPMKFLDIVWWISAFLMGIYPAVGLMGLGYSSNSTSVDGAHVSLKSTTSASDEQGAQEPLTSAVRHWS